MSERYKAQSAMIGKILEVLEPCGIEPISMAGRDYTESVEEFRLFVISMNWLIAEGIVRVERNVGDGRWIGCHLTARGMYLLGRHVDIGGDMVPMRNAVKEAQSGSWDHSKMGDFLGSVFGGVIKSLTS